MHHLAVSYSYNSQTSASSGTGISVLFIIIYLVLFVVLLAGMWKTFVKAGQKGWKAIIPIYNTVIMFRIVGMSGWYTLLMLVPFVNFIMAVILYNKISKAFGHGIGMTILALFSIGFLILGFGKSQYLGPNGAEGNGPAPGTDVQPQPPVTPVAPAPPAPAV